MCRAAGRNERDGQGTLDLDTTPNEIFRCEEIGIQALKNLIAAIKVNEEEKKPVVAKTEEESVVVKPVNPRTRGEETSR